MKKKKFAAKVNKSEANEIYNVYNNIVPWCVGLLLVRVLRVRGLYYIWK